MKTILILIFILTTSSVVSTKSPCIHYFEITNTSPVSPCEAQISVMGEDAPLLSPHPFIQDLLPYALHAERIHGIHHKVFLAQAIYESGWGEKCTNNNLFGIKPNGKLRSYCTYEESINDYIYQLTQTERYCCITELQTNDPLECITCIQEAGWNPNKEYIEKIMEIVNLNL